MRSRGNRARRIQSPVSTFRDSTMRYCKKFGHCKSCSRRNSPSWTRPRSESSLFPSSRLTTPHQTTATNASAQLLVRSSATSPSVSSSASLAALTHRATTAERHLASTSSQLGLTETALATAITKFELAEGKWAERLKELEGRLKEAEEKVRRERKGAKDRVGELGGTIKYVSPHVLHLTS